MDQDLVILHALGSGMLYVGAAVAGVWFVAGVFAVIDAWRTNDPRRSTRRR